MLNPWLQLADVKSFAEERRIEYNTQWLHTAHNGFSASGLSSNVGSLDAPLCFRSSRLQWPVVPFNCVLAIY
jgi:hypothetical protein